MEKNNKYCVSIVKWTNNLLKRERVKTNNLRQEITTLKKLRQEKMVKNIFNSKQRVYVYYKHISNTFLLEFNVQN